MPLPPVVLASASPRRRRLLGQLGLPVDVRPAAVDERSVDGSAASRVAELARRKAEVIAAEIDDGYVLAADTLGDLEGTPLGKPGDDNEALRMLWRLSDRTHDVMTGVVALRVEGGKIAKDAAEVVVTRVTFRALGLNDIRDYLATGEHEGKAAAYAIQGEGRRFVQAIEGSYTNVVGLPIPAVIRLLESIGYPVPDVDVQALDLHPEDLGALEE